MHFQDCAENIGTPVADRSTMPETLPLETVTCVTHSKLNVSLES